MDKPDPGLIYDLYIGAFRPQVVRLALQLDLFTPLADGPADAAAVARDCGCSPAGVAHLLDALVATQVISRQESRYQLTPSAATFLVRRRPAYAGDLVFAWTGPDIWRNVAGALRTGQPAPFEEFHVQDAWLESYSEWRIQNSLEMWRAAGIEPRPDTPRRLLDLACGCAIKSLALARLDPALRVTGLDTPSVIVVALDLADRMGLSAQTDFLGADLMTADLGADLYDACLLGQITHYLTPEQNQDLFRRVHRALRPGCPLVIDVPMTGDQPSEWTEIVSLLLWANGGGHAHSFGQYHGWLEAAGFEEVRPLSERWTITRSTSAPRSPTRSRRLGPSSAG